MRGSRKDVVHRGMLVNTAYFFADFLCFPLDTWLLGGHSGAHRIRRRTHQDDSVKWYLISLPLPSLSLSLPPRLLPSRPPFWTSPLPSFPPTARSDLPTTSSPLSLFLFSQSFRYSASLFDVTFISQFRSPLKSWFYSRFLSLISSFVLPPALSSLSCRLQLPLH